MYEKAEEVIMGIKRDSRYHDCVNCWLSTAPVSPEDFFRRWLFAYASIQTGWARNVVIYSALKDLEWVGDKEHLRSLLIETGAGMHNGRTRNISAFSDAFWDNPAAFYGRSGETWAEYRRRLVATIPGMGMAKTSFVLEMTWPTDAEVICIDTHVLRLYGCQADRLSRTKYEELEAHWVKTCKNRSLAPAIARAIYWDDNQGYENSDSWNCVFNDEKPVKRLLKRLKRIVEAA
jgi:thermostable 8-oxoguanine DNA glycosylase